MKCPKCGRENDDSVRFCTECGTEIKKQNTVTKQQREKLTDFGTATASIGKAARAKRMAADIGDAKVLSPRMYNLALIGTVLWGVALTAVLCALVGNIYDRMNAVVFLIIYFAGSIGGCVLAYRSQSPAVSLVGFTIVSVCFGLLISTACSAYLEIDPEIVYHAFLYTALISFGMLGLALAFPQLFDKLGGALLGCLGGLVLCELILLLFGVDQSITEWIGAGIFTLYIGYDIHRSQQFPKTADNAVDCALDVYMDIANLFLRILSLLAKSKDDD